MQQFSLQTAFLALLFPIWAAYPGVLGVVLNVPHEPPLAMNLCGVCPCRDQIWGNKGQQWAKSAVGLPNLSRGSDWQDTAF